MVFFCLVGVAYQTVSVFYFPTTEVATCSPRLPNFSSVNQSYQIIMASASSFIKLPNRKLKEPRHRDRAGKVHQICSVLAVSE